MGDERQLSALGPLLGVWPVPLPARCTACAQLRVPAEEVYSRSAGAGEALLVYEMGPWAWPWKSTAEVSSQEVAENSLELRHKHPAVNEVLKSSQGRYVNKKGGCIRLCTQQLEDIICVTRNSPTFSSNIQGR